MSEERRCDTHGPYTAHEAAMMVLGRWQPIPSGYRCPTCAAMIRDAGRRLAEAIDARAAEEFYAQVYGKNS